MFALVICTFASYFGDNLLDLLVIIRLYADFPAFLTGALSHVKQDALKGLSRVDIIHSFEDE